jgi:hypothetical protein
MPRAPAIVVTKVVLYEQRWELPWSPTSSED